jgi:mono/diheme cytochrome c family protein
MKKTITIAVLVLAVIACHRKTVPASNIIISNKPNVEETKDIKVDPPKTEMSGSELAAQGKTVYTNRCGRCHGLKNTESFTASQWENILKAMIPKARLNDEEGKQVTAYVMANAKK